MLHIANRIFMRATPGCLLLFGRFNLRTNLLFERGARGMVLLFWYNIDQRMYASGAWLIALSVKFSNCTNPVQVNNACNELTACYLGAAHWESTNPGASPCTDPGGYCCTVSDVQEGPCPS